jgi:tryptophan synthase alpha chain
LSLATTSSESALARLWAELRRRRRTALIPYLTAGHPTPQESLDALRRATEYADILELGIPFSDPLADGPTIQRSTFQALAQGMSLPRCLELLARSELDCPVVLFSYLNPVLRYGLDRFLRDAAELRVAGLLLTDLPAGGDAAVERAVSASPLDLIRMIAPTTTGERLARTVSGASGFLYLVARLGVTGARPELAHDLAAYVGRVRQATDLPLAVGFGISTPAQARAVGDLADGVVVGSALVELVGREGPAAGARFLASLRAALDQDQAPGRGAR